MREIRVKNASIHATLGGIEIDFEIRTGKDSAQGFALYVGGQKWLDVDLKEGKLVDGADSKKEVRAMRKNMKCRDCRHCPDIVLEGNMVFQCNSSLDEYRWRDADSGCDRGET